MTRCSLWFPSGASPNLDILDMKFDAIKLTFEGHVGGIVCRDSLRIYYILRLVRRIFVDIFVVTSLLFCICLPPILDIILQCGGQLLNVPYSFLIERQVFSVARLH